MKRIIQNKKPVFLLFLNVVLLLLVACNKENEKEDENQTPPQAETTLMEEPAERREFLMGTYIVLRVYDEGKEEALDDAVARIEELDKKLTSNGQAQKLMRLTKRQEKKPSKFPMMFSFN